MSSKKKKKKTLFLCYLKIQQKKQPFKNTSASSQRRQWHPTPVLLPGRRSLVGCRLWGRTESDTTEVT